MGYSLIAPLAPISGGGMETERKSSRNESKRWKIIDVCVGVCLCHENQPTTWN